MAQDLGSIASEGTLKRIATALEGMSSGGGGGSGGSSAKLYRHTIKAWANYREMTPGGEIDGSAPLFSSLTLVVYGTTETPLTITDISNEEMRTASIKDFQKWDAPDMYRAPLFAEKNDTSIKIYFVNGFTTDGSGNLSVLSTSSVTSTKYNFEDTVSEV